MQTLDAHRRRRMGPAAGLVLFLAALWLPFGWPLGPAAATAAGNCKLALDAGQAAPGSGTPSTVIDFTVVVSYKAACSAPETVRVTIAGLGSPTLALTPGQPSTAAGITTVTYSGQRKIGAAGTWPYEFAARLTAASPWVVLAGQRARGAHDQGATHPETDAQTHPQADAQTHAEAEADSEGDGQADPEADPETDPKPPKAPPKETPKPRPTRAPETTSDPKETPVVTTPPAIVEPSAPSAIRPPAIRA